MTLCQLQEGDEFRVAGAHVHLHIASIRVGEHASRIRVYNVDPDVEALIGRKTIHEYVWANDTPVYNVIPANDPHWPEQPEDLYRELPED